MSDAWQPIDTAPKDRQVLLFIPRYGIQLGEFDAEEFRKKPRPYWLWSHLWGATIQRAHQPTHWMPLPKPPGRR